MSTSPANMKNSLHAFSSLTQLGPQVSHVNPKSDTTESPPAAVSNRTVSLRSPRQPRLSYSTLAPEENPPRREEVPVPEEEEEKRSTWNLRPRRACVGGGASEKNQKPRGVTTGPPPKSTRQRGGTAAESHGGVEARNENRRRLWVALSREEIEDDVFSMSGNKPSRKPRKRARTVQKHLDVMFPGLGLVGMNADSFKVTRFSG